MDQHSEPAPAKQPAPSASGEVGVRHFREIVLWPIYLSPSEPHADVPDYAQRLLDTAPDGLWQEVADEFTADPAAFQERHYNEFVAFLPAVQRFLYGQGRSAAVKHGYGDSPIRVLRRMDIQQVRVQLGRDDPALLFDVAHVDLYFFFDIDIAVLTLEILADNMTLRTAQEVMFQFGRAYPSFWEEDDTAGHCPWRVEWLGAGGEVLAASDYGDRHKYLAFTAKHRAPCLASHWEYLLRPLALDHTEAQGPLRYRQLEYYRMPLMAFLALDDPGKLGPNEIVQLALANGRTDGTERRGAKKRSAHFEAQRGSARFREIRDEENSGTRYLSSGRALVVAGDAGNPFFTHLEHGVLARFRHQDFLLFLIAHFHRAALLMFSDRLAEAVGRLDIGNVAAVQAFRRATRHALETFLRFTHRYWFSEVSDQTETADLFALCRQHLGVDRLYADIRQEVQDMSQYLETEAMRRQNETIVRLTVVTIFGLIGTIVTGFLGMNLFAYSDETALTKLWLFFVIFVPTVLLTLYTVKKSRQLSEFLDSLSAGELKFRRFWRGYRK